MDLIMLVFALALIGGLVWAITTYIPMPSIFKTVIQIIAVVVMFLYLLRALGTSIPNVM